MTIQPGQSHSNVCVIFIDDDIKERPGNFRLVISIPSSVQKLGVKIGSACYTNIYTNNRYYVTKVASFNL